MKLINRTINFMLAGVALPLLAGCGAQDIASPGTGGNVIVNPTPTPSPTPTPTPTTSVTPAAGCPTIADPQGLTDAGTITGSTGTWRVCSLPAQIRANVTLPKLAGLLYQLPGRVDVGCDRGPSDALVPSGCTIPAVTLTIEPGVIVYGGTGVSWLAVNRGNKINAVGTVAKPIIFTSRDNVLGLNDDSKSGQWGGVVLLGRAPTTDCAIGGATPGSNDCYRQTEGAADPAYFGGQIVADNSGTMRYVQIRYSGYVLGANSELQSLTLGGVGSATTLDHIQSHNSSDDAVEAFGGVVNMKHFVSTGAEDDILDTDTGVKANIQFVLGIHRAGGGAGDSFIEADSDNAFTTNTPRQNTKVSNATFIGRSTANSNGALVYIRGAADYTLVNSIVISPNFPCLGISQAATASATVDAATDEAGAPVFRSVQMQCPSSGAFFGKNSVTAADVQAIFQAGTNNSAAYTPSLVSVFVNGITENGVSAFDVTTLGSFFTAVNYIGAVKDANDSWYQGWTCNSGTATFDNGSDTTRACTSLPTA
ncbi:hypothetical protein M2336_003276 [Sphingobium sp. B1D7B]|uniref:hypothetical protein n=1 Tax=unclassified Sphingobium TaxID=2611147 RepID=UPI002224811D|nr:MULTISPECIES: hypothetical protein [unclassified Sphingobium]MCW2391435.1 hypothetical protein [Sphingobium sp. B11D3A]MCW2406647.1 hypothetical protein [Sphingobium sp. B1D7B]